MAENVSGERQLTGITNPHISRIGHWMDFRVIPASSLSSNRAIQAIR
jgi:hypothetical protein